MKEKEALDYLLIPNSSGKLMEERKKVARKELGKRVVDNILILNGKDSEEDILYLGKILKKGERVGFDTFPLHYKEYKLIIKKAIKQGKFPRGVKVENIKTPEGFREKIYGSLGLEEEKILHEKISYMKDRKGSLLQNLKNFIKKIFPA